MRDKMSGDECIFCKIVSGAIPCHRIFEDDDILVFLDIGPLSYGHTLVIPKQHYDKLHDCPPEILEKLSSHLGTLAVAVTAATEADGYNVLCNNGRAAGQLVDHVHFHIIPRNVGDGVFSKWNAGKYEQNQAEEIARSISENLTFDR